MDQTIKLEASIIYENAGAWSYTIYDLEHSQRRHGCAMFGGKGFAVWRAKRKAKDYAEKQFGLDKNTTKSFTLELTATVKDGKVKVQ